MHKLQLTWIAAALLGLSTGVSAGFDGNISYSDQKVVGGSDIHFPPFHYANRAGIGSSQGTQVDFQSLKNHGSAPAQGVYQVGSEHSGDSNYSFAQVASQDVWFGEWSAGGARTGYADRAVYYVGDDTGTTVPTSGVATYNVAGINQFDGTNKLTGTYTADFGIQKLEGSISNSTLKVDIIAGIDASTAAFQGVAYAEKGGVTTPGETNGHFFGADAASLAGIAKFISNRDLDTAFGGTKQ